MTRHSLTRAGAGLAAALGLATPVLAENVLDPLLTPAELAEVRASADPLILDIRGDGYGDGHIPGAVHAPYGLFRGPAENPGRLPSEADLTETLRGLGVTTDRPVVVVHQGRDETDFGAAARVYWTLKSSGVADLGILNGGVTAWQEAGMALSDAAVTPEPSQVEVRFSDEWMATAEEVQAVIESGAPLADHARRVSAMHSASREMGTHTSVGHISQPGRSALHAYAASWRARHSAFMDPIFDTYERLDAGFYREPDRDAMREGAIRGMI